MPETLPTDPVNAYGNSKLAVDRMISDECRAHGLGAVSLRYFNVAGASGDLGEDHEPETHLIPLVLQAAAGTREHVSVFGTDYPTDDGTAVRDYIHIEDLGEAHILGLEQATNPGEHRIYNLGNGTGFSVRQVIEAARAVTGRDIDVEEEGRRPGDPAALVASSEKIREELGWDPSQARDRDDDRRRLGVVRGPPGGLRALSLVPAAPAGSYMCPTWPRERLGSADRRRNRVHARDRPAHDPKPTSHPPPPPRPSWACWCWRCWSRRACGPPRRSSSPRARTRVRSSPPPPTSTPSRSRSPTRARRSRAPSRSPPRRRPTAASRPSCSRPRRPARAPGPSPAPRRSRPTRARSTRRRSPTGCATCAPSRPTAPATRAPTRSRTAASTTPPRPRRPPTPARP